MIDKHSCYFCGEWVLNGEPLKYPFRPEADEDAETLVEKWVWEEVSLCQVTQWVCTNCTYVSRTVIINFESLIDLSNGNPDRVEFLAETEAEVKRQNALRIKALTPRAKATVVVATPAFAKIVGEGEMRRIDAVNNFWNYVKANGLQTGKSEIVITADHLLQPVFGTSSIQYAEAADVFDRHLNPVGQYGLPNKP